MKKIMVFMALALFAMAGHAQTQVDEREMTKQERKAFQVAIDSVLYEEAVQAVQDKKFTLEADKVIFKYGEMAYVNSNTNFVSVNGDKAVVQVAFNIPVSGPNGLGGVTVDGNVTKYQIQTDKKGVTRISMDVMGIGISAQVFITMPRGTNSATLEISPNFNSNRLTLSGFIVPIKKSSVFKGRSL